MIGNQSPVDISGEEMSSAPVSSSEGTMGYKELAEIFSSWLPYLSQGCCDRCCDVIKNRVENLSSAKIDGRSITNGHAEYSKDSGSPSSCLSNGSHEISHERSNRVADEHSARQGNTRHLSSVLVSPQSFSNGSHEISHERSNGVADEHSARRGNVRPVVVLPQSSSYLSTVQSWPEKANKDHFGAVVQMNNHEESANYEIYKEIGLSRDENEEIRFKQVGRKKDFVYRERVNGRMVNIVEGLELHTHVFNRAEQKKIVDYVYKLQEMGKERRLKERTYSEPRKWMRGKGRVTIQFGCCYNYAVDKKGNLPGILRDEEVDPIPTFFKTVIKRLVRWHVLPKTCIPNSCIVNIYDEGDCIPPHIDHHDFVRPFCTVSFLTEADIVFGSSLKIGEPGEFFGPVKIPLPVGSVLILNGNGADVAKHCVPSVPAKRISITFRKMDDSKLPYRFKPDPDFEGMQPFSYPSSSSPGLQAVVVRQVSNRNPHVQRNQQPKNGKPEAEGVTHGKPSEFHVAQSDFPPLGGLPNSRPRIRQYPLRR